MAFVVAEPCIKCKYTDCVTLCPVDAFREAEYFLVIDPETCIDCGACVPACPSEAIYPEHELPRPWRHFAARNAELAPTLPVITGPRSPQPDAADWRTPGRGKWQALGDKERLVSEEEP